MRQFVLALILAVAGQSPEPAKQPLADAETLFKAGLNADAIAAYDGLLKSYPTLAPAHLGVAKALLNKAVGAGDKAGSPDFLLAETHFRRAIDLAGDAALRRQALFGLAGAFAVFQPARMKEGTAIFDEIVKQRPLDVTAHLARARVSFTEKTIAEYVAALKAARDRFPRDSGVRSTLGIALRDQATWSPRNAEAERRRLLVEATVEFDQALRLDAEAELALMYKGLPLRDLAGLEKDPGKAAALEAESKQLFDHAEKLHAQVKTPPRP